MGQGWCCRIKAKSRTPSTLNNKLVVNKRRIVKDKEKNIIVIKISSSKQKGLVAISDRLG